MAAVMQTSKFSLRPYQLDAINRLRQTVRVHQRVALASPTGSGKTAIGCDMVLSAQTKNKRVLWVANRIELIEQASSRLDAIGIDHGVIQAQHWRWRPHLPVQVGSIQTLSRRQLPAADLVIIDEAHGATSKSYRDLIAGYPDAIVIGLTATPFSKGLGQVFSELVSVAQVRELIDMGYLVDTRVFAPSAPDLSKVHIRAGDYREDELGVAVDRPQLIADIVATWRQLGEDRQTICFATNIAHSKHIVEQFQAAGIAAEHLDAYIEPLERQAILQRLASGETRIVSNVAVLAEGFDCPVVSCCILARPTRSLARYIQMVGRVLRPYPGKDHALVLDHANCTETLGFVTDPQEYALDDGKPKEAKARERLVSLPKKCTKCHYIKPAGVSQCPGCGFKPERQSEVAVGEGTLVEIKKTKATMPDKRRFYAELMHVARAKGYAKGWISHKYREKFGVWPTDMQGIAPQTPSAETLGFLKHLQIKQAKTTDKPMPACGCGAVGHDLKPNGPHLGAYCRACGAWLKWVRQ